MTKKKQFQTEIERLKKIVDSFNKTQENCIYCKQERNYSENLDAYYCKRCDYWIERICKDKKCYYCSRRKKYPSMHKKGELK